MGTFHKLDRSLLLGTVFARTVGTRASPRETAAASFRAGMICFDTAAVTVRSRQDSLIIRTFANSHAVRAQVEKLVETGDYLYRDRVRIRYQPFADVAPAISGKPTRIGGTLGKGK